MPQPDIQFQVILSYLKLLLYIPAFLMYNKACVSSVLGSQGIEALQEAGAGVIRKYTNKG